MTVVRSDIPSLLQPRPKVPKPLPPPRDTKGKGKGKTQIKGKLEMHRAKVKTGGSVASWSQGANSTCKMRHANDPLLFTASSHNLTWLFWALLPVDMSYKQVSR